MRIRTKIILMLLPAVLLALSILIITNFDSSRQTVIKLINNEALEIANTRVIEFDITFESAKKVAEGIAISVESMQVLSKPEIENLIQETLKKNKNIYGSTVSLIPDKTDLKAYAPYYYQNKKSFNYVDLNSDNYKYQQREWFKKPLELKKGVWLSPYLDEGGGDVLMTTYAIPITRKNEIIGVATVDISLADIVAKIKKLTIGGQGFAFIITKEGKFIAHPSPEMGLLSKETIWDIAKKRNNEDFNELVKKIENKDSFYSEIIDPFDDIPSLMLVSKIETTDWSLVLIYPKDQLLIPLHQLMNKNIMVTIIVLILLVLMILWLSSSLTSPIIKLVEQTYHYSNGKWDEKLDETIGVKEIRQLSKSFNKMGDAIKEQIETVKTTTAQKERYQQELNIAAEIQQSILPQTFPPFPELEEKIDLYGLTKPAKEIGGDYYDFFKLKNEKIGIVIADVSDKGAPSSFFMAMTRMIVREVALRGASPAEVLRRTNYMLSVDNPHCMFVTLIYGEYHANTGCLRYANAGHNPPFLLTYDQGVKEVPLTRNIPLGIEPATHYVTDEICLKPNETLFLYTDGISEASNAEEKMIGAQSLKQELETLYHKSSAEIVHHILEYTNNFCGDVPQHDDITMLCLKNMNQNCIKVTEDKKDANKTISLRLPAKTEVLDKVADITTKIAEEVGFDEKEIYQLNLAMDEIVSNLIMHSYSSSCLETFQLDLTPIQNGLEVVITDYGIPFNFEDKIEAYDPDEATVEQSLGGIGLFLVGKSVDHATYDPETIDGNKITLVKYCKNTDI